MSSIRELDEVEVDNWVSYDGSTPEFSDEAKENLGFDPQTDPDWQKYEEEFQQTLTKFLEKTDLEESLEDSE